MKTRSLIALAAVLLTAALSARSEAQPRGPRAADCTECARSCTGRCVAQAGGCSCVQPGSPGPQRFNVDDCYAACSRQEGANATALELCRADCRTQSK